VRKPDAPPITRGVVLRIVVLVIAVALAGAAGWLVVTGKTVKRVELGVIVGFWSALLGGFALYDARRSTHAEPASAQSSTELELRSARTELQRAEEAAARRAHEARLEQLLRAEVQAAITREITSLRAEIADLRGELLEKVGNQVRLERIETTRVIGSDLEALQHEVRQQLQAVAREVGDISTSRGQPAEPPTLRPIVETARVRPVSREAAEVQAELQPATSEPAIPEGVVEAEPPRPAPGADLPPAESPRPTPTVDWSAEAEAPRPSPPPAEWLAARAGEPDAARPVEITGPIRSDQPRPAPAAESPRPSPAPAAPDAGPQAAPKPPDARVDTLSGLPRIEPFTAFELDPIEDESAYTGRRRRREDGEPLAGRHTRSEAPGRRHRDDDDQNDLLARLLARESH
jgi:hypothetical protein